MRNELEQPERSPSPTPSDQRLAQRSASERRRCGALSAPAVDEALADEATLERSPPHTPRRGSRRELAARATDAERRIVDLPHGAASAAAGATVAGGPLLVQLAEQLRALQAQQEQIRWLLEQAEQQASQPAAG